MFNQYPVSYVEPVFRPPSEASSLIFQVTNGCSWNRCTYCDMYTDPQKKFRPRAEQELLDEISRVVGTSMTEEEVQSPCINFCELSNDNTCNGCYRTLEEIGAWSFASDEERRQIVSNAKKRQAIANNG